MPPYETLSTLPDPTFRQLCEQTTADMDRLSIPGVAAGVLAGDRELAAGFGVTSDCRVRCGACCIAPSISSPIPGMPNGKPAGVRCVQLTPDHRCRLFGHPDRPAVCIGLRPSVEMCGQTAEQALAWLSQLELATHPNLDCS